MLTYAFEVGLGHSFGSYIVIIALLLFAYTTILAWAYCAEKALGFLFGHKNIHCFKYVYVIFIPLGPLIHVDLIWILADISISFMLITNLVGIAFLSKEAIEENNTFFQENIPIQVET
jgi:AGCS family alanine or glycine:cation symporter